jgi:glycerol dehydrogenase
MTDITITGARFPGRYIQGPGLIARLGIEAQSLGARAFCLLDRALADRLEPMVRAAAGPLQITCRTHGGECSEEEIAASVAAAQGTDLVIGVGGGKTLDTAKMVAHEAGVPMVVVPTIAASDAPCSALAVVYNADGTVLRDHFLPRNPELVLVDTQIIAEAPARFMAAGIGDALATFYEADSSLRAQALNCWGIHGAVVAHAIAALCRDVIFADGVAALAACDAGAPDPAFERVVEANILLSCAGFESGGVAGAHAIHHGLCELPDVHHHLHGEKVALGVQAMLLILAQDAEYARVRAFCEAVRLPVRLSDIGIAEATDAKLRTIADRACKPGDIMENEPLAVTPDMVIAALKRLI